MAEQVLRPCHRPPPAQLAVVSGCLPQQVAALPRFQGRPPPAPNTQCVRSNKPLSRRVWAGQRAERRLDHHPESCSEEVVGRGPPGAESPRAACDRAGLTDGRRLFRRAANRAANRPRRQQPATRHACSATAFLLPPWLLLLAECTTPREDRESPGTPFTRCFDATLHC